MLDKSWDLDVVATDNSDPAALEIVAGEARLVEVGGAYDTSRPYLTLSDPFTAAQVEYLGFDAAVEASGGDAISFVVSDDGGVTWHYAWGGGLAVSDGSAAQSSEAAALSAVIGGLGVGDKKFVWRAFFTSLDGSTTPRLGGGFSAAVTLQYSIYHTGKELSALLLNIQHRLESELGIEAFVVQSLDSLPATAPFPLVAIKDGGVRRTQKANGWFDETLAVELGVYVQDLSDGESASLAVLDLADQARAALLNYRFGLGTIGAADFPSDSESQPGEVDGALVQRKVLGVRYERSIHISPPTQYP